jgi:vancomycin permeability regulator SanA
MKRRMLILLALIALLFLAAPRWILEWRFGHRIVSTESASARPTAIVFGAGLRRDGQPTAVLADRIRTAVELYHSGKAERLLMSGSVRPGYDEPEAMAAMARDLGVAPSAILLDPGGVRTLESCRRATSEFGVQSALLVSQRFHLPRALALCGAVGIQAEAVAADRSSYSDRSRRFWELREYPASLVAMVEALLARHSPTVVS